MSSPEKKRKTRKKPSPKLTPTPELTTIPSLPDDLLLSCFARVSRLYYPNLALVSKSFRSLLASLELYATRSSLDRTESCLYVCLRFPLNPNPNPRWFTLCGKPNKNLTNQITKRKKKEKSSSGYALATIPIPNNPPAHSSSLVTIGPNIYSIGGCNYKGPSSSVSILDCRSHTLRDAPAMGVERYPSTAAACVLDGKIYVNGRCQYNDPWMEIFDPNTQTWELVSSPGAEIRSTMVKTATIDGKIYMYGSTNCFVYDPKESSWEIVEWVNCWFWIWFSSCVIDNVIYCYDGKFRWYDTKVRFLGTLKGLKGLPKIRGVNVKLVYYGGKMAVLWDKYEYGSGLKNKMICCAVIVLEKRNDGEEIWGEVEWCDDVLTVPNSYEFVHTLAATV